MKSSSALLFVVAMAACLFPGCGSSEPTVIQPESYELNEQQAANRERAEKLLSEQRQ